jgi:hypothetical protein
MATHGEDRWQLTHISMNDRHTPVLDDGGPTGEYRSDMFVHQVRP